MASDALIIVAITFATNLIPVNFVNTAIRPASPSTFHWLIPGFITVLWLAGMSTFHTRDRRIVGVGAREYKNVMAAGIATFGIAAVTFLLLDTLTVRKYFIIALPVGVAALVLSRWVWRRWLSKQRKFGRHLSRVIVVGRHDDVEYVVDRINAKLGVAFTVVGAVDFDNRSIAQAVPSGTRVLRKLDTVAASAAALDADAVIVAGEPNAGSNFIRHLAWQLEGTATELILASRLADIAGPRIHFRPVEGLPLIHVEIPQFEGGKHVVKRALDITGATLGLLILSPLFAVLAMLIRLDSPGPALFSQSRVGLNGKEFRFLKLRSMVMSAPDQQASLLALNEGKGPLFKMKSDPRVTHLGRMLRKYSLDELPQLWNVLIGDMSLVGPRPPLPQEILGYDGEASRRLYIKPGLTGMWQVNGRSDLSWEESVRLDLYYVENWSVIGDLVILWRTVKVLIHPVGAY